MWRSKEGGKGVPQKRDKTTICDNSVGHVYSF